VEDDGQSDWVRPAKGFIPFVGFTATSPAKANRPPIPNTWQETMKSPDKNRWLEACESEASRLEQINAWDLIDKQSMPKGLKPIPGRWVFDIKDLIDGTFKYKACWVIRGNLIKRDPYYGETTHQWSILKQQTSYSRLQLITVGILLSRRGAGNPQWKSWCSNIYADHRYGKEAWFS
jgi:hypothetical protein